MPPLLPNLGTLFGAGTGILSNTLNPQNKVNNISNMIINKGTAEAEINNANLTVDGLKKSYIKSQQSQAISDINSAKKNAEAIQY